jgi:demethylmenaquinone methyltransferase/2-methoxy-6-polyprenyl-1,4-benzoquinol methylase
MTEELETAQFFDQCAARGDMDAFAPEELVVLERFLAMWGLRPGQRVLEPGCGSGRLTALLAGRVGPEGEVVACDLSEGMIARARQRELPAQVKLVHGPVQRLTYTAAYFDHVMCVAVFPHLREPARVLADCCRMLKPGGSLWIHHFAGREKLNAMHQGAHPKVASHQLPEEAAMRTLIAGAGLAVQRYEDRPDRYTVQAIKLG